MNSASWYQTFSYERLLIGVGIVCVLFFSSYRLLASPEPWMDEGLIIQSAEGLLHTGSAALPVAPGIYEPAWYITTGFPVTVPIAVATAITGTPYLTARCIMVLFLLSFFATVFIFVRKTLGGRNAWISFFLLVFFAPLYGHGRNVLGEVPGLFFIVLALLPLIPQGELTRTRAVLAGLGAGLACATKPIFLLLLPALFVACVLRNRELNFRKYVLWGMVGIAIPMSIWLLSQFESVTLSRVLAVYANPRDLNVTQAILINAKRFFTESQPFYFLSSMLLWTASYSLRRVRQEAVSLTEETLFFFAILVSLAFMRTDGYYRYFLPAQVFAILYLPVSVSYLVSRAKRPIVYAAVTILGCLLLFEMYETGFRSWTAIHYDSQRAEALTQYFVGLPPNEDVFVYQAPEVVPFIGQHPFYQYVRITPTISAGNANLPLVDSGSAKRIITSVDFYTAHASDLFAHYSISHALDNYVIVTPRQ